jgi:hypothetical protein
VKERARVVLNMVFQAFLNAAKASRASSDEIGGREDQRERRGDAATKAVERACRGAESNGKRQRKSK